ncbi:hypothetical protein AF74_00420 [Aliarcobacter butzleri L349]|nr:hypothetical protein AF74_00420 [Aliarcobacter butzleri L349]
MVICALHSSIENYAFQDKITRLYKMMIDTLRLKK